MEGWAPSLPHLIAGPILLAIGLSLSTGCASRAAYRVAQVAVVTTQATDIHSTHGALSRGAVERNPLMPTDWRAQLAVKAGAMVPMFWSMERLSKTHPKLATAILAGIASGYAAISARNYHVAREQQR